MRTIVIAGVILALVAFGMTSASAQRSKQPRRIERTITSDYECPCGAAAANQSWGWNLWGRGGKTFETTADDRYVRVSIDDTTSQVVAGRIAQDTDGDNELEVVGHFCGTTRDPIEIEPGHPIFVSLFTGTCEDDRTQSFPTKGTMSLTLSNLP